MPRSAGVPSGGRRLWRAAAPLLVLAAALAALLAPRSGAAATTPGCSVSGPASGAYSISLCIASPPSSAVVGDVAVTLTATVTGTDPGIRRLTVTLDGADLITDFEAPFAFTLPTARFPDGRHSLSAVAVMRDGFTTAQASVGLTFRNGVRQPPVNPLPFTPATGAPVAAGAPFTVVAVGEGADGGADAAEVSNLAVALNPNLFLYLGNVYDEGTPTEFLNWYGSPTLLWGRLRAITNPAPGNRDHGTPQAAGYRDYWNNAPSYYSVDAAGWHIISLDSTTQFGQRDPGTAQYQWLEQDLATRPADCTLAFFNTPLLSVGPEGDDPGMAAIWSLLARSGVDLVLTAHETSYQRWVPLDALGNPSPAGVTQFVVGTGGRGATAFVRTDPRLAFGIDNRRQGFGVLQLELRAGQATYRYVNVNNRVIDSGSYGCTGAAPVAGGPPQPVVAGARCTITGTSGPDTLRGTPADDVICGLGGPDTISGEAGNDRIIGGPGDDDLGGDAGDDTVLGGAGDDRIRSGTGRDLVRGGPGRDDLNGGPGGDRLLGEGGPDTILGGGGPDRLDGGPGNDVLRAGPGIDTAAGGLGNDDIDGSDGADRIDGGLGRDRLRGGLGRDRIAGGAGPDAINVVDHGPDLVNGGAGVDRALVDRAGDRLTGVELIG
jgi:Big-like domain-containing protein/hemolysin type calcium-binding protein/calcineurin-like phosphoesterase family protein